jgi:hypothetical protein
MSENLTIEISSAYRNRIKYPNPSYFEVNINQNTRNIFSDENIVSKAYPSYNFIGLGIVESGFLFFSTPTGLTNGGRFIPREQGPFSPQVKYGGKNSALQLNEYGVGNGFEPNLNVNTTDIETNSSSNQNDYYTGNYIYDDSYKFSTLVTKYTGKTRALTLQNYVQNWNSDLNIQIRNNSFGLNIGNNLPNSSFITIQGGESSSGFYDGLFLEDVTIRKELGLNERFKLITKYDGVTRLATIDSGFPNNFGKGIGNVTDIYTVDWTHSDMYRIRQQKPLVIGFGFNTDQQYPWIYSFNPDTFESKYCTAGIGFNNLYNNGVVEVEYISGNVEVRQQITLSPGNVIIEITCINPVKANVIYPGDFILEDNVQVGTNLPGDKLINTDLNIEFNVKLVGQCIDISRAYNGSLGVCDTVLREHGAYDGKLFFIPFIPEKMNAKKDSIPSYYRQYPIFLKNKSNAEYLGDYSGATIITKFLYGKVDETEYAFIVSGNDFSASLFQTATVNNRYTNINPTPLTPEEKKFLSEPNKHRVFTPYIEDYFYFDWEILPINEFSNQNLSVIGGGSSILNENEICYKINITTLTLPNLKLNSGNIKGLLAFNPYVYIELNVVDKFNMNTLISNNENGKNALFKIPITDISNPTFATFIKIASYSMQPIVKFKPNDNLILKIYFGNGEILKFDKNDFAPPLPPDPLKQITLNLELIKQKN